MFSPTWDSETRTSPSGRPFSTVRKEVDAPRIRPGRKGGPQPRTSETCNEGGPETGGKERGPRDLVLGRSPD